MAVRNKKTIFIVDDEEMIREIAVDMLDHMGYNVILAKDGLDAIEIFSNQHSVIDLVLVDLIMPRMNGLVCYEKLKAINPDVPIIIASGLGELSKKQSILEMGAVGYLEKPYSLKALKEAFSKVFD